MKKLIVAMAIAIVAVATNAAVVNWNVTNIQSSPDVTVSAGWFVQVFDASTVYSYEAAKAGTITALDSSTSFASGTIFRVGDSFGDYAAGAPVNVYAVIYDAATIDAAKNYIVSAEVNKSINASGSPLTLAFGNMASTASSNFFKGAEWQATQSIPEPTSGLLLILGLAGLALKRKHA